MLASDRIACDQASASRKPRRIIQIAPVVDVQRMTIPPREEQNFTLDPSLFRVHVQSQNHKVSQKAAIVKLAVENADFLRNAQ